MNKEKEIRKLNCAIYTRKSTEEGLGQDFNTLDAQRESAESYIKSQEAEGWVCLPIIMTMEVLLAATWIVLH